jgi:hypothetical protein
MAKKRKPRKDGTPDPSQTESCELIVCEDPITGKVILRPRKGCPPGTVEKLKKKINEDGLWFPRSPVKTEGEDE